MSLHPTRPRLAWLGLSLAIVGVGCTREQAAPAPPSVPVTVARVTERSVPVELRAIGTLEAYSTVSIKSQVSGPLTAVHFREGQDVKRGDLLFTIDRRPFEVALQEAEANLARDVAQAENARAQAHRYEKLLEEGVVAKEQYDQFRTAAAAFDAAVRADQAAVERAKLDLEYCTIVAPLDGRTGSLIVHQGNLVKANEAPALVVINQLTPIYVNFAIPEQALAEVKRFMAARKLEVQAFVPGEAQRPETGVLSFVDNAVDPTTGTIHLKATFANRQRRLWPGQFVNVVLILTAQPNALVVPTEALQTGQSGQYVFVVKPDQTVESRPVTSGITYQGLTVIEKGLAAGETVVTDGQSRLLPGARVAAKNAP